MGNIIAAYKNFYQMIGLTDYKLKTLEQLKMIHGIDVLTLPGYDTLSESNKALFDKAIIDFYNIHGFESRIQLEPKCVYWVKEVNYDSIIPEEERYDPEVMYNTVAKEVYAIDPHLVVLKRLHRYVFEKGNKLKECEKFSKIYLRFELNNEWFHILPNGQFY